MFILGTIPTIGDVMRGKKGDEGWGITRALETRRSHTTTTTDHTDKGPWDVICLLGHKLFLFLFIFCRFIVLTVLLDSTRVNDNVSPPPPTSKCIVGWFFSHSGQPPDHKKTACKFPCFLLINFLYFFFQVDYVYRKQQRNYVYRNNNDEYTTIHHQDENERTVYLSFGP